MMDTNISQLNRKDFTPQGESRSFVCSCLTHFYDVIIECLEFSSAVVGFGKYVQFNFLRKAYKIL